MRGGVWRCANHHLSRNRVWPFCVIRSSNAMVAKRWNINTELSQGQPQIAPSYLLNIASEVSSRMFLRMGYESGVLKHHNFLCSTFFKLYWYICNSYCTVNIENTKKGLLSREPETLPRTSNLRIRVLAYASPPENQCSGHLKIVEGRNFRHTGVGKCANEQVRSTLL